MKTKQQARFRNAECRMRNTCTHTRSLNPQSAIRNPQSTRSTCSHALRGDTRIQRSALRSCYRRAANYGVPTQSVGTSEETVHIRNPHSARRGILLLVVLSMLTLFLLIGTAFIVSSNQYRKANKIRAKLTEASNSSIDQQDLLNEVINQLVRDTNNPFSSIRYHSLLRDMYGNDGVRIGPNEGVSFFTRFPATFDALELVSRSGNKISIERTGNGFFPLDRAFSQIDPNYDSVGDQFFWVATEFRLPDLSVPNANPRSPLNLNENYYNGRIITFIEGELQGTSARIVRYNVLQNPNDVRLRYGLFTLMALDANEPIRSAALTAAIPLPEADPWPSTKAVINGMPFNGTGVGYDALARGARLSALERVDLVDGSNGRRELTAEIALMPNATFFDFLPVGTLPPNVLPAYYGEFVAPAINSRAYDGLGSSDESYDAVDFQNMAMALVQPNAIETVLPVLPVDPNNPDPPLPLALGNMVLPSFHRPALLHYWAQNPAFSGSNPKLYEQQSRAFLRKVMMRPNWWDHENFDGSNPDFANATTPFQKMLRSIYGPWDVDNDLDGVRDSVWIDAGLPVMENTDGRLVKPLVAMLVVDMDGRLNLNAHGSEDVANSEFINFNDLDGALADNTDTDNLPHGQGYGPAEVSLDPLMPYFDTGTRRQRWKWYRRLFTGAAAGQNLVPDITTDNDDLAAAIFNPRLQFLRNRVGKFGGNDVVPGNPEFDVSAQLKMQGVPFFASRRANVSNGNGSALSSYGTLPDYRGRYALGLNDLGQPVTETHWLAPSAANPNILTYNYDTRSLVSDLPYELNLSLGASRGETALAPDGPYTVAELERILRPYDADVGALPSRIWEFAGEFKDNPTDTTPNLDRLNLWRTSVTTDSYDLPVPNVELPEWMYVGPDGKPGRADRDDDSNSIGDDPGEIGWENSDDFQAVMNPQGFTGRSIFPATQVTFADLLEYRFRVSDKDGDGVLDPSNEIWYKAEDDTRAAEIEDMHRRISRLIPREIAAGRRLDINRPLGNGRDDNNNGVVDEPGELDATGTAATGGIGVEPALWATDRDNPLPANFRDSRTGQYRDAIDRNGDGQISNIERGDINDDGTIDQSEVVFMHNLRRQDLARDLYIMAMTLVDPLPIRTTGTATNTEKDNRRKRARRIAQWAINVVDFRDPDNIMTAFEYDENPFNGWEVDGNIADGQRMDVYGTDQEFGGTGVNADKGSIVWGAEAQELVMTETMAWHDRRTTDEGPDVESAPVGDANNAFAVPDEPAGRVFDSKEPDRDFDQLYRPQGACFVELYCPLSANPAASADTHLIGGTGNDLGINLRALAVDPNDNNRVSPVWRMAVFQRPAGLDAAACDTWDPDAEDRRLRPSSSVVGGGGGGAGAELDIDRSIYFARFDTSNAARLESLKTMDGQDGVEFFTTLDVPPVRPGRMMVVGSGIEQNGNGVKSAGRPLNQRIYGMNIGDIGQGSGGPRQRRIELRPNDPVNPIKVVEPTNTADQRGYEITYKDDNGDPICDVAVITNALSSAGPTALSRRFSITEPAEGYPGDDPTNFPPVGPTYLENIPGEPEQEGRYGNVAQPAAYDIPHDDARRDGDTRLSLRPGVTSFQQNDSLIVETYSMLYLQRLANPLLPFDKDTNPYRTIDGMSANVSLFNGKMGGIKGLAEESGESYQTDLENGSDAGLIPYGNRFTARYLGSVQRGYTVSSRNPAEYQANVLGYEPPNIAINDNDRYYRPVRENDMATGGNAPPHAVQVIPHMTLGMVNEAFQSAAVSNALQRRRFSDPALSGPATDPATFDGLTPEQPFPWLTWNNRPFANSNELMLVPRSSSAQLLREFTGQANPVDEPDYNPYSEVSRKQDPSGIPGRLDPPAYRALKEQGEFGHLPNMQLSEPPIAPTSNQRPETAPAGFNRVLDYVHVNSPFVATESWLNPSAFGSSSATTTDDPRYLRQPPFNRVSSYREPGRINLNTVVSGDVWDGGLLHRELFDPTLPWNPQTNNYLTAWLRDRNLPEGPNNPRIYSHTGPRFVENNQTESLNGLCESRRGYTVWNRSAQIPTVDLLLDDFLLPLDASVPTFFANPFRASDAGSLVPLNSLQRPGSECSMMRRRAMNPGVDGGWGLGNRDDDNNGVTNDLTEFTTTGADDVEDKVPLFGSTSDEPFNNGARHAYFGFQPMTRLSSMTTNRSNVYAVWVTIGFFEVQEAPDINTFQAMNDPAGSLTAPQLTALYERVYPEGYQFGKEAGSDTGDIRRVREFAVIDRTIPVAFEPGENHNVDKTIRLRTRIE